MIFKSVEQEFGFLVCEYLAKLLLFKISKRNDTVGVKATGHHASVTQYRYVVLQGVTKTVGAFIGCIVGALLIFMQSPLRAIAFVIMFLIIQQLENHLIYPRVVGTSVGLPAIWTFAALIAGGAVYGVVGMILFIPAASVIYSLLRSDVNARIRAKGGEAVVLDGKASDDSAESATDTENAADGTSADSGERTSSEEFPTE